MFQEERLQAICEMVAHRQSVKVSELSEELNISVATVRRDLEELQRQGRVMRTHGGAMLPYSVGYEIQVDKLGMKCGEEKRKIARKALSYIQNNDTLLIDESSTAFELVRVLAEGGFASLTIMTTSLKAVQALSHVKNYQVVLVGGCVNYDQSSVEGYAAVQFIQKHRVDKCFIGVNGIDKTFGFSTPRLSEAEMKTAMIASSRVSYVLADHTKFGKCYFANIPAADYVVTDTRAPGFAYESLERLSEVFFADGGEGEEGTE